MTAGTRFVAALGLAAALAGGAALADVLVRDYDFPEKLSDHTEKGPRLEALRGMLGFGNYRFEAGHGLVLADGGVSDQYAVEITFRFEKVDGWQKIIDFKDRASDVGLYVYNGSLQFYPFSAGGEFRPGETYRVRLERDRATKRVSGYLNDAKVVDFDDVADDAVFQDRKAAFFVDDLATRSEESAGEVKRIRIWDGPGGH